jgi:hypothetical protein
MGRIIETVVSNFHGYSDDLNSPQIPCFGLPNDIHGAGCRGVYVSPISNLNREEKAILYDQPSIRSHFQYVIDLCNPQYVTEGAKHG